jgi:hypothetical protein
MTVRIKAVLAMLVSAVMIMTAGFAADIEVGDVHVGSFEWGTRNVSLTLTNLSIDYRFIVATANARFLESNFQSPRDARASFLIAPGSSTAVKVPVEIAPNFGKGIVTVTVYDVVDTLDMLLASQEFFTKEFPFSIEAPDEIRKIIEKGIYVPFFVEKSPAFDNAFSRIFMLLLHQGKSLDEIARICKTTPEVITSLASRLKNEAYIGFNEDRYFPKTALLDNSEITAFLPDITAAVGQLYEVLVRNLSSYDTTVARLAGEGKITRDPNDLLDGSSVLYHKYPVVFGLCLWNLMGRDFVNSGLVFNIFENSDPCNARMGDYMYMVTGPYSNVGRSFYYYVPDVTGERFFCGLSNSSITCAPDFRERARMGMEANWSFEGDSSPTYYSYSPDKTRPSVSGLAENTAPVIDRLQSKTDELIARSNNRTYARAVKYWCWSMVVGELMEKFEENGILKRDGNGIFLFQKANE